MKRRLQEHLLLHLQDARRQLDTKDYAQVEFDIYEIGEHLGLSPLEINNDLRHDTARQPR